MATSTLRRDSICVFLSILAFYLATAGGHLYSPDAEIQFRTTQALATGAGTAIEPLGAEGFATRAGRGGREYAQYGVGMPLLAIPFYALGAALDATMSDLATLRAFWPTTQYHGGSPSEWRLRLGVSFFNQVVGALLALLFFLMARRLGLARGPAWMATLLLALGTLHWAHSRTFFSEPAAALFLFGAFFLIFRWHQEGSDGWARPVAAGLLAGFAVLIRKDSALFFPGLCLYAALPLTLKPGPVETPDNGEDTPKDRGGRLRWDAGRALPILARAAAAAGGMLLGLAAHFLIAWLQFGDPTATGYEDQPEGISFSTPLLAGLYGFLFSAGKGLFFFSPALVLAVLGLGRLWRRAPLVTLGAALAAGPFFLAMCKWQNWAGGWCWGPRHIYQMHIFLALGLVGWLVADGAQGSARLSPLRRGLAWLFLLVGAGVQIYGCSQSFIDYYILHYRLTDIPPTAYALYTPGEAAGHFVSERAEEGGFSTPRPLGAAGVPAPINDSVYVPQNSQWYGYAAMWRAGMHDFFWWHAISSRDPAPATDILEFARRNAAESRP